METQSPAGPPPFAPPPYAAMAARQRTPLRDVVLGWRAALAVLIAGIVVGGLGGAGLMAIIDHHGGDRGPTPGRFQQFGPPGGFGGGGDSFGRPGTDGSGGAIG